MSKEYIERDRPFSLLKNYLTKPSGQYNAQEVIYLVDDLLSDTPAADVVEVRHGRWIWDDDGYWHRCSCCRMTFDYEQTQELFDNGFQLASYCPNCGAKMDGGVNDADALGIG